MRKFLGIILTAGGLISLVITGINYIDQSERFKVLGLEVTVSESSIIPIVISGLVLLLGIALLSGGRKT